MPDQPVTDENPQTNDYNSSKSDIAHISVGEDSKGNLWFGVVQIDGDGRYRIGTHGGDSVTVGFDEYGSVWTSELRHSSEFDGALLEAIEEALSMWEKVLTTGGEPIATNEEGISKEK